MYVCRWTQPTGLNVQSWSVEKLTYLLWNYISLMVSVCDLPADIKGFRMRVVYSLQRAVSAGVPVSGNFSVARGVFEIL